MFRDTYSTPGVDETCIDVCPQHVTASSRCHPSPVVGDATSHVVLRRFQQVRGMIQLGWIPGRPRGQTKLIDRYYYLPPIKPLVHPANTSIIHIDLHLSTAYPYVDKDAWDEVA
jgi:hypothetical protein